MPPDFEPRELLRLVRDAQRKGFSQEDILADISDLTEGNVSSIGQLIQLADQQGAPVSPATQQMLDEPDPLSVVDRFMGAGRQAFQTGTFGFGDEIAGLAARLPGGRTPEEARSGFQQNLEEFREQAPIAAAAGGLAGILTQGAGAGAGARLAGRGIMSLLTGAAPQAARGTVAAGRSSLAARQAAIEGGQRVPRVLAEVARRGGRGTAVGAAAGAAEGAAFAAGGAEGGFTERLSAALSPEAALGGAVGGAAGGVIGIGAGLIGASRARRHFFEAEAARLGQRGQEIAEEAGEFILPPSFIRQQADETLASVSEQFKRFEALGALDDATLRADVLSNPSARKAMERLSDLTGREVDDLWTFQDMQDVAQLMSEQADAAIAAAPRQAGQGSARLIRAKRDEFLDAVDESLSNLVGEDDALRGARTAWREALRIAPALEDGIRLARTGSIDDLHSAVAALQDNPEALQAFRQGLGGQLFEDIANRKSLPTVNENLLERAKIAFGGNEDALAQFEQAIRIEEKNQRTRVLQKLAAQLLSFKTGGTSLGGRVTDQLF